MKIGDLVKVVFGGQTIAYGIITDEKPEINTYMQEKYYTIWAFKFTAAPEMQEKTMAFNQSSLVAIKSPEDW